MTTTGELKFKLALEDEGINWNQAEAVVELTHRHLLAEHIEREDQAEKDREEINLLAYRGREVAEVLDEGLLADLKALSKPLPDGEETLEDLQEALAEVVRMYSMDVSAVRESLNDIEEMTR